MTVHESRMVRHEVKFRRLQVRQVQDLTPHLRRIVLEGPDLAGFHSASPDDHVKLFFPNPDGEFVTPTMTAQGPVYPAGRAPSPMRDYTPRAFDAQANTLVLDFVLHGDGVASRWAEQAAPGAPLAVGGPRGSFVMADDFDHYVLVGDETALPAVARWLEEAPAGRQATVLMEVDGPQDQIPLPTRAKATVQWLYRNGAAPEASELLENALDDLAPAGDAFWWIACESQRARQMRKFLEGHRAVPKAWIRATGYWKSPHSPDVMD